MNDGLAGPLRHRRVRAARRSIAYRSPRTARGSAAAPWSAEADRAAPARANCSDERGARRVHVRRRRRRARRGPRRRCPRRRAHRPRSADGRAGRAQGSLCGTRMPLTAGSRVDVADRAPGEGTIVRSAEASGAIILGKTRTTEFAFGTFNPSHPTPRNPCDRARAPDAGRIVRRLGRGAGGGLVRHRVRHGHRRLGAPAGGALRRRGIQGDGRPPADGRRVPAVADVRQPRLVRTVASPISRSSGSVLSGEAAGA